MFRSSLCTIGILAVLLACSSINLLAEDDWIPITPEELALKSVPGAPDAHAVMLYHEYSRNDLEGRQRMHFRIKILSEEGKKWADIEIPFVAGLFKIKDLKARTVRPDGTSVPFEGKVYEKIVAKRKGVRVLNKTFNFPDVQPGTIIEYKYQLTWEPEYAYNSTWWVQQRLHLLKGRFELKPVGRLPMSWAWFEMSEQVKQEKNGLITLDVANMKPYEKESYMPPEDRYRL